MPFFSPLPSLSAIYARLHWLPRLRGSLYFASNSGVATNTDIASNSGVAINTDIAANSDWRQDTVRVYSLNATAHPKRIMNLKSAVDRALEKVWPEVVEYATKENITGELWAQIRCGFHTSGAPGSSSRSSHATIRIYDVNGRHVGGIHAPEDPAVPPSFKGGIKKLSYHGEQKIEENLAFKVSF